MQPIKSTYLLIFYNYTSPCYRSLISINTSIVEIIISFPNVHPEFESYAKPGHLTLINKPTVQADHFLQPMQNLNYTYALFSLFCLPPRKIFREFLNFVTSLKSRALHPLKQDIGYCLKTGNIVNLKSGYWILPTENGILGYWDIGFTEIGISGHCFHEFSVFAAAAAADRGY